MTEMERIMGGPYKVDRLFCPNCHYEITSVARENARHDYSCARCLTRMLSEFVPVKE